MKLREANTGDIEAVAEVMELLRKESRYSVFPLNKDKLLRLIEYLVVDDNGLVLLSGEVKITGLLIARIGDMYFSDCKVSSDFIFYVSPESRKQGIGSVLIDGYFKWARKNKVDDISLSTSTGISDIAMKKVADKHGMKEKGMLYGRIEYVRNT